MVISFLHTMNVRTILACHGLGIPVIVSERCDPSEDDVGKMWDLLRRLTYRRAARVVAQTLVALGYFLPCRTVPGVGDSEPVGDFQVGEWSCGS